MVKLKSVSSPPPSALESAAVVETRKVLAGNAGADPGVSNLAAEFLLGKGKSAPIVRPAVGGGALESIIGQDERTRILETAADPWRMICALLMTSESGSRFIGTAWLAGPKTLITAGHNVNSADLGGWAKKIEISPGRNGNVFPRPTITVRTGSFSSVDRWVEHRDKDYDIAAIHLDQAIGDELGWFAVGALPAAELEGFLINVSGYPLTPGNGQEQWFHRNRILRATARRIFYDVDTTAGQSGSPAWIYENEDAHPLVVGIHAYGTGGTPPDLAITANSAPRIIPEVLDQIEAWIEKDSSGGG